jgi:hypothetical protein
MTSDDDPILERYEESRKIDDNGSNGTDSSEDDVPWKRDEHETPDEPSQSSSEKEGLPSNGWHKAVALSTFGWVFLLVSVNSISDVVFTLALFTVWFLLPLGVYYDAKRLRSQGYAPPSYWWLYVVFSFIWFICIPVGFAYLILRRRR